MRLDAHGRPLDTVALPIAPNSLGRQATERRYPDVVWYEDAFWVVWQEYRGSGVRDGYGRRVRPTARLSMPFPFGSRRRPPARIGREFARVEPIC
jgi:hypothetical protein